MLHLKNEEFVSELKYMKIFEGILIRDLWGILEYGTTKFVLVRVGLCAGRSQVPQFTARRQTKRFYYTVRTIRNNNTREISNFSKRLIIYQ